MAGTGSASVTVHGGSMGGAWGYTGNVRQGETGCEATGWESETSTRCLAGGSWMVSRRYSITSGLHVGSMTHQVSFDGPSVLVVGQYQRRQGLSLMGVSTNAEDFLVDLVNKYLFGSLQDRLMCALDAVTSSNVIEEESRDELLQWSRAHRLVFTNVLSRGGVLITIQGSGFGVAGSARVRVGVSGCEGSEWVSATSVLCLAASGLSGTMRVGMSVGIRSGSASAVVSYDRTFVSGVSVSNRRKVGSAPVILVGSGFGGRAYSAAGRMAETGCKASEWFSETSLRCHGAGGLPGPARL
eukprot:196548-Rhodomonas_salina.1